MPPRAWLANYRHYLERLLLSVEELSDPHWEPDTSIDVFLQARVCPAVYFLQRCAVGEGGLQGAPVDIPASEKEELRLLALRLTGTVVREFHMSWHNLCIDLLRLKFSD
jgi:hypothetical protein